MIPWSKMPCSCIFKPDGKKSYLCNRCKNLTIHPIPYQTQQSNNLIRKRLESAPVRVGEIRDGSLRPASAENIPKPFCLANKEADASYINEGDVYHKDDIKQAVQLLKEDIAEELCRTGFTEDREQNKVIRDISFEIFLKHIDKIFGEALTNG